MRLIDADELKMDLDVTPYNDIDDLTRTEQLIDSAPTVPLPDFKEGYKQAILDGKANFSRPHGKWVESDVPESILSKCSLCGFHCGAKTFNFCPMCGADMRGDKEWK